MSVRWLAELVLLSVWLLAACGGRTIRDFGSDAADAGSDAAMDTCGDGVVAPSEACDGAAPLGVTCADLGFDVGEVQCSSHCTYDGAACAHTFSQVSAGGSHTCGILTDASVTCWGADQDGQASPPAGTFAQVSAGWDHTCGVKTNGSVACWGADDADQAAPLADTFSQVSAGGSQRQRRRTAPSPRSA